MFTHLLQSVLLVPLVLRNLNATVEDASVQHFYLVLQSRILVVKLAYLLAQIVIIFLDFLDTICVALLFFLAERDRATSKKTDHLLNLLA